MRNFPFMQTPIPPVYDGTPFTKEQLEEIEKVILPALKCAPWVVRVYEDGYPAWFVSYDSHSPLYIFEYPRDATPRDAGGYLGEYAQYQFYNLYVDVCRITIDSVEAAKREMGLLAERYNHSTDCTDED